MMAILILWLCLGADCHREEISVDYRICYADSVGEAERFTAGRGLGENWRIVDCQPKRPSRSGGAVG